MVFLREPVEHGNQGKDQQQQHGQCHVLGKEVYLHRQVVLMPFAHISCKMKADRTMDQNEQQDRSAKVGGILQQRQSSEIYKEKCQRINDNRLLCREPDPQRNDGKNRPATLQA